MKLSLLCAMIPAFLVPLAAEELTLAENGATPYRIVIAEQSAKQVTYAAEELSTFLKEMTGAEFNVVSDKTAAQDCEIVLGETNRSVAIPDEFAPSVHEGYACLVVGKSLQIRGKTPRATLYGVYDFLDEKLGVRFLAFDGNYVPRKDVLKVSLSSYKYDPPYDYRNIISAGDAGEAENVFMVRARLNSSWGYIPLGSKVGGLMHLGGFVHNLHYLMPHSKYFAEHPEYFAWRDGARRDMMYPHGQFASLPCLTNPDAQKIIIAEIRRILKEYFSNPNTSPDDQVFFPVDYHDHDQVCQCEACNKVNEEEESNGGTLFRFLNMVSDEFSAEYPNVVFSTLAYGPTLKPGKTTLRKNIVIRFAPIEMDNGRALDDPLSDINKKQLEHLKNWRAAGTQFYVWYYAGNFNDGITPHADLKGMEMNFPLLNKLGMRGMFMETVQNAGIEMKELRSYVASKMLWRPEKNARELVEEFCRLYYGKGGSKVLEYIDMIHDYHYSVVDSKHDNPLTLRGAPPYRHAYTAEIIDKADEILYEAEEQAESKQEKLRVAVMHMPMWYLRLTNAMNTERRVAAFPEVWRFKTDPGKAITEQDDSSKWGTVRTDDFWTRQDPYREYRGTAWYAVDFEIEEKFAKELLSLYFASVDGRVEAFIDGKKVGDQLKDPGEMWNVGFFIHLPEKLTAGKHELKVKVTKDNNAAGIWKPVALVNLAQKLSEATRKAGEKYMQTESTFVPVRRNMDFRNSTFERIRSLLEDKKMPVTSLKNGSVTKQTYTFGNVHKTFAKVDDDGAMSGHCVEQLPEKDWTQGQSIGCPMSELFDDIEKLKTFHARVRIKVKKKGNEGLAAKVTFCYYNKKDWSGGNCAPALNLSLADLPDNEWVWVDYPHVLRYKADVRYQLVSVACANNPENVEYVRVDAFEFSPEQ